LTLILYEIRATKRRVSYPIRLVTKDALADAQGFRSVYGYDTEVADMVLSTNSTRGLMGMSMFSDELLIDIDDDWSGAEAFAEEIGNYSYSMYDTGGRSIHFHIPIDPMYGAHVPAVQKQWAQEYCPCADMSIYRTSGVYRLPGTYHEKNPGKFKELIEVNEGETLTVSLPQGIDSLNNIVAGIAEDIDEETEKDKLNHLLLMPAREGGRNNHLYRIVAKCATLGFEFGRTMEIASVWNQMMSSPPQPETAVEATVKSAYLR